MFTLIQVNNYIPFVMLGVIDEFNLTWIRADQKAKLSSNYPEADAFQKICGAILNDAVYKEASTGYNFNLISFSLQGKDGAIDHYSYCEINGTAIVECKKNGTVKNCLAGIGELQNKLSRNLSKKNASDTIYRPWFNTNLKTYIFCTSCLALNAGDYEKIVREVRKMLNALSTIPGLSHLHSIEVRVYCWQHLKNWMERSPFLMHSWVEPVMEEIKYVSSENLPAEGYQSYLSSGKMTYSSRDEFMRQHPEIAGLPSEKQYLNTLINNKGVKFKGIVIHGQGGIGKTRLMYEFALMAKPMGWMSYVIKTLDGYQNLVRSLKPGGKYFILIDYIEEFDKFQYLVKNNAEEKRAFEVKFIVNCRSSYFHYNKFLLKDEFIVMDISDSNEASHLYNLDLINKIIKDIPGLKDVDKRIFERRPSFAVFVRYLYETNKQHYSTPNRDTRFLNWLVRRLELSFSGAKQGTYDEDLVTMLFSCLPAYGKGLDFLEQHFTREINILITDGWLEKRNTTYSHQLAAIHDSIVDELLIEHVRLYSRTLKGTIKKYFSFAAGNTLISSCIRSFERISDISELSGFNFSAVLTEVINELPDDMVISDFNLGKSSLISEEDFVFLLSNKRFNDYVLSDDFWIVLIELLGKKEGGIVNEEVEKKIINFLNNWYWKNKDDEFVSGELGGLLLYSATERFGFSPKLEDILNDHIAKSTVSYMAMYFLQLWIEEKGPDPSIVTGLKESLARHVDSEDACDAIVQWLDAGGELSIVADSVEEWLERNTPAERAGRLIGSWLNNGGDLETVGKAALNWLELHKEKPVAWAVIVQWLQNKGNKPAVEPAVKRWLALHGGKEIAHNVIGAWVETGGNISTVATYLKRWLTKHAKIEPAYRIIEYWLDAGGDKGVVSAGLNKWMGMYPLSEELQYVVNAWLRTGGNKSLVAGAIERWLNQHGKMADAYNLICVWLTHGGDKSLVSAAFKEWLKLHAESIEAGKMITSWLQAGGERSMVSSYIVNWLQSHEKREEAYEVMAMWLQTNGDKSLVASSIKNWLELYGETEPAYYVTGLWLQAGGDISLVASSVEKWLAIHAENIDAARLMYSWLSVGGDKSVVGVSLGKWLEVHAEMQDTYEIIRKWLQSGGEKSLLVSPINRWLTLYTESEHAFDVIGVWLEAGGEKSLVVSAMQKWLSLHSETMDADILICLWLQADGDVAAVEPAVMRWLAQHAEMPNAYKTIYFWLKAGGSRAVVDQSFIRWMTRHRATATDEAETVLELWVKAGGDASLL